ncbi:VCBS repeat protein [Marinicella litoralis]|uniref:VCBS repeat protein n=1 Tax=Marinicella litoralis TaxID=644220 RepID=A0A4R6XZK1_9GAMM|nr:VCBS repeat protein [Marinicella litoralis]
MALKINKIYLLGSFLILGSNGTGHAQQFVLANQESQLIFSHINAAEQPREATMVIAGGAVADFDFDGYPDFYLLGGSDQNNALFKNNNDGTFTNIANQAGVDLFNILGSGPTFADVDGDFDLDLMVFSINLWDQPFGSDVDLIENRPRLFINQNDGTFLDTTTSSGFYSGMPSYAGSFADLDQDGDLDLFMTHWSSDSETTSKQLFWQNNGSGQFTDVTIDYLGFTQNANLNKWSFTPHITDINEDGWIDVLLAADFETTRIFYGTGGLPGPDTPLYMVSQPSFISDENGMGSAVADYDNDGDLDWFVTSIWDPNGIPEGNWGVTGNRLYKNLGSGVFEDATDEAGVREGYWGWGACFADFNNDGYLDIYHENGFANELHAGEFLNDPARLFMSNGNGTFTESSASAGLHFTGQGRGISCVDYDLDGDLDILIIPNNEAYQLYKNTSNNSNNYLSVNLFDHGPNPYAINAKIKVNTTGMSQLREVSSSNNYVSNNPLQQHFGLGLATSINSIEVTWPDGMQQNITNNLSVNEIISIGRYCHTTFIQSADISNQTTEVAVYLHDLMGLPLSSQAVSLTINKGPNTGVVINSTTDPLGRAIFTVNSNAVGTDRISYSFNHDNQAQICRSLIKWNNDIIFVDRFE